MAFHFNALPCVFLAHGPFKLCGDSTVSTENQQKVIFVNSENGNARKNRQNSSLNLRPSYALGFEWYIEGDDNHNAIVKVSYRKKGENSWKEALPLLRIQNEECIDSFSVNWIDYVTPNLFAGSIMDLQPDTDYECKFILSDPDGVYGTVKK